MTNFLLSEGCMKSEQGEYCMDVGNDLATEGNKSACFNAVAVSGTCPDSPIDCMKELTEGVTRLGCCAGVVHRSMTLDQSISDSVAAPDASTPAPDPIGLEKLTPCIINMRMLVTRNECQKPPVKTHKKRLGMKLACSKLTEEVRASLIDKIPKDIATAAGISPSAISNVNPKCDSSIQVIDDTPPAETQTLPPGTANATKNRRFRTLQERTTSGIAVDYNLKAENDADTERASQQVDRKIQNNELALSETQAGVSEVCLNCGTIDIDKTSSKTLAVDDEASAMGKLFLNLGVLVLTLIVLLF